MRPIYCEEEDRVGSRWVLWRNGLLPAFLKGEDELDLMSRHKLNLGSFEEELKRLPEGSRLVPFGAPEYPATVCDLEQPPPFLYIWGAEVPMGSIACIGTRKATRWDEELTEQFVGELVEWGAHISSGGAIGIDIAAHRAALRRERPTTVVLPGGIDVAAPARHRRDFEKVLEVGGSLVSLQPLGTQAFKSTFAPRNALLAALSEAILVLRSGVEGGTMITVSVAERLGREIFALPGDPRDQTAEGCLQLLRSGRAKAAWTAEHIIKERRRVVAKDSRASGLLDLIGESVDLTQLQIRCGLDWEELQTTLFELEIGGHIARFGDTIRRKSQ